MSKRQAIGEAVVEHISTPLPGVKFTTFLHHNLFPLIDVSQLQQRAWSVGDDGRFWAGWGRRAKGDG